MNRVDFLGGDFARIKDSGRRLIALGSSLGSPKESGKFMHLIR